MGQFQLRTLPISVLTVLTSLGVLASSPTCTEDRRCLGSNQKEIGSGIYHFKYDSVVSSGNGGRSYVYSRCICNLSEKEMYVFWEKANLRGYALPGVKLINEIEARTNDYEFQTSRLWYGTGKIATTTTLTQPKPETKKTTSKLTSTIELSLLIDPKQPNLGLVPVKLEFVSKIDQKELQTENLEYSYSWRLISPETSEAGLPYKLNWKSESITRGLNEQEIKRVFFEKFSSLKPVSGLNPRFKAKFEAETALTNIYILDQNERVIGSGQVNIFYPTGTEP